MIYSIPTTYTAIDRLTAPKPAERVDTATLIREHLNRKKLKAVVNSKKMGTIYLINPTERLLKY